MSGAETLISLLNDAAVSIYGGMLSASFCGALNTRRNRRIFWRGMVLLLIPQAGIYLLWEAEARLRFYPLVMHLPLMLLLWFLTQKLLWSAICVLSSYLLCQGRRWLALLAVFLLGGGDLTQKLAELAFTLPLLLVFLRFISPAVRQLMEYPVKTQCLFGLIPALYYAFDYLTRIYTNLLFTGSPVVLEFMPTVCCVAYLVSLLHNSAEERKRSLLRQTRDNLKLQVAQAAREIGTLRESQAITARYRHDLRHHLQYLLSCMENGQTERAKNYISGICEEIEAQQVRHYCENETVNLILSAFADRAEKAGLKMDVRGALPAVVSVGDNDLCLILSNALENALHACLPLAAARADCVIDVEFRAHKQRGRFFCRLSTLARRMYGLKKESRCQTGRTMG